MISFIVLGVLWFFLLLYVMDKINGDYEPPANAEKPIPEWAEDWDFHEQEQIIIKVNPRQGRNLPRS